MHKKSTLWPSEFEDELKDGNKDITFFLQNVVTHSDRTLKYAELQSGPRAILVIGLRSTILDSFERFIPLESSYHLPCDIPALTTGLALIILGRSFGITNGCINNGGLGEITLVFETENLGMLSGRILTAFSKWDSWLTLMMDALGNEPIDGNWSFEWQEFLSGESGYVTMDWFETIPDAARSVALNHLVQESKSVLRSLLSTRQFAKKEVHDFVMWVESLRPLPFVVGHQLRPELQEVWI